MAPVEPGGAGPRRGHGEPSSARLSPQLEPQLAQARDRGDAKAETRPPRKL